MDHYISCGCMAECFPSPAMYPKVRRIFETTCQVRCVHKSKLQMGRAQWQCTRYLQEIFWVASGAYLLVGEASWPSQWVIVVLHRGNNHALLFSVSNQLSDKLLEVMLLLLYEIPFLQQKIEWLDQEKRSVSHLCHHCNDIGCRIMKNGATTRCHQ